MPRRRETGDVLVSWVSRRSITAWVPHSTADAPFGRQVSTRPRLSARWQMAQVAPVALGIRTMV